MANASAWSTLLSVNGPILSQLIAFLPGSHEPEIDASAPVPAYSSIRLPDTEFELKDRLVELGCASTAIASLSGLYEERKEEMAATCRSVHRSMWRDMLKTSLTTQQLSEYYCATESGMARQFVDSVGKLQAAFLGEVQAARDTQLLLLAEQRASSTSLLPADSKITTGFTEERVEMLEAVFADKPTLTTADRVALAQATGLEARQVSVWFANARMRRGLTHGGSYTEAAIESAMTARKASAPYPTSIKVNHARSRRTVSTASSSTDDGYAVTRSRNSSGKSLITYEEEESSGEEDESLDTMGGLAIAGHDGDIAVEEASSRGSKEYDNTNYAATPSDSGMTVDEMLEDIAGSLSGDMNGGAITESAMDDLVAAASNRHSSAVFSPNAANGSVYSPYSPLSSLSPSPIPSGHPTSPNSHLDYSPAPSAADSDYLPPPSRTSTTLHTPLFQRRPSFLNGLDLTIDRIDETFWNSILDDYDSTTRRGRNAGTTVDLSGGITLAMDEDFEMN